MFQVGVFQSIELLKIVHSYIYGPIHTFFHGGAKYIIIDFS